jgi:hypothetical protein
MPLNGYEICDNWCSEIRSLLNYVQYLKTYLYFLHCVRYLQTSVQKFPQILFSDFVFRENGICRRHNLFRDVKEFLFSASQIVKF